MSISSSLRTDLLSSKELEQVFQKHIIDGSSYFFNEVMKQSDQEYELRHDLAKTLGISINDIVIVGSAKMGFSLKTHQFKEFDSEFKATQNPRDMSDIDIAIINKRFFEKTIEEIFHLSRYFDHAWINQHWKTNVFNRTPSNLHKEYALYLAKGWLRPDLLPMVFYESAAWRSICEDWRKKINLRKISIGFYSDWIYLKHYQMKNLEELQKQLNNLEIF